MGHDVDTDNLLDRVAAGDREAVEQLLARYRERLKRMINLRMDRRLAPRVDGSDVVQETLAEASRRLSEYARLRPIPFYPWLRQIAWNKLVELHRWHFREKRSVSCRGADRNALERRVGLSAGRLSGGKSIKSQRPTGSEGTGGPRAAGPGLAAHLARGSF